MRVTSQRMQLCGALVLILAATFMLVMSRSGFSLEVGVSGCKEAKSVNPSSANDCTPPVLNSTAEAARSESKGASNQPSVQPEAAGSPAATTVESNTGSGLKMVPCPPVPRTRGPSGIGTDIKRPNSTCGESSVTGAVPIAGSVDIQVEGSIPNAEVLPEKERYSWVEGYINDAYVWGEVRVLRSGQIDGYVYRNGDRIQVQGARQANDQIIATDAKGNYIALKLLP